jgi:hypothetical protein
LKIPENLDAEEIVSAYTHDKAIHVNKEAFLKNLEFVGEFVYSEVNERIYIEALDEEHILIKSDKDADNKIKHTVKVERLDSDQIGYGFWVARKDLYNAVNVIDDSDILIQVDLTNEDKSAYNVTGLSNNDKHVALSKLK